MALHEQSVGASDEWYTPPHVFEAMGVRFDLDVAYPDDADDQLTPAVRVITKAACGLSTGWRSQFCPDPFVWMNPPFGGRNALAPWLAKFFDHGNGVALVPDRTSAPWWQGYAPRADLVLFVRRKLRFLRADGTEGASPAQGTTLMAVGEQGCWALRQAASAGLGLLLIPASSSAAPIERRGRQRRRSRGYADRTKTRANKGMKP